MSAPIISFIFSQNTTYITLKMSFFEYRIYLVKMLSYKLVIFYFSKIIPDNNKNNNTNFIICLHHLRVKIKLIFCYRSLTTKIKSRNEYQILSLIFFLSFNIGELK